jgi:hypothetical protein
MPNCQLTVQTPNGPVTRKSARPYLVVIVAGRYNPAYLDASEAACEKNYHEQVAKYKAMLAIGPTAPGWPRNEVLETAPKWGWVDKGPQPVEYVQKLLADCEGMRARNQEWATIRRQARNVEVSWSQSQAGGLKTLATIRGQEQRSLPGIPMYADVELYQVPAEGIRVIQPRTKKA